MRCKPCTSWLVRPWLRLLLRQTCWQLKLSGAEQQPDSWWQLCATTVRHGLIQEPDEALRQQLATLLRVHTSHQGSSLVSLDVYVERAAAEQSSILYLAGVCCCWCEVRCGHHTSR